MGRGEIYFFMPSCCLVLDVLCYFLGGDYMISQRLGLVINY